MNELKAVEKQIAKTLGHKDPDTFALQQMRKNLGRESVQRMGKAMAVRSVFRRTGRTTRMVVKALSYAAHGKSVVLMGYNLTHSRQLVEQAREYATKVGINPRNILAARSERGLVGLSDQVIIFRDEL